MSDTEKISVTLKAGQGFDSPWIVVHADSAQEAATLLDAVALTGLGLKAATTAKGFQAEYAASELGATFVEAVQTQGLPAETAAQQAPAFAQPQTQSTQALPHDGGGATAAAQETLSDRYGNQYVYNHPAAPLCQHGVPYTLKSGTNKAGKAYSGWFCAKKGPKPVNLQGADCAASFNGVPK